MNIMEIKTVSDFGEAIGDKNTGWVVIDFFADWCGPCKQIAPFFASLEQKYQNVKFYKLNADTDELYKVGESCDVKTLPTFCFFKHGNYINKLIGADTAKLENTIYNLANRFE